MCRLRRASCKYLAPIFFTASPRSVRSESTRLKHLWRRGRKATVSFNATGSHNKFPVFQQISFFNRNWLNLACPKILGVVPRCVGVRLIAHDHIPQILPLQLHNFIYKLRQKVADAQMPARDSELLVVGLLDWSDTVLLPNAKCIPSVLPSISRNNAPIKAQ